MHPVLVQENVDFEPNEEELTQYGRFLGMSFPEDDALRWLCREGLTTPMPSPWQCYRSLMTDDIFYWDPETGASSWDHPVDDCIRKRYEAEKEKRRKAAEAAAKAKEKGTPRSSWRGSASVKGRR